MTMVDESDDMQAKARREQALLWKKKEKKGERRRETL